MKEIRPLRLWLGCSLALVAGPVLAGEQSTAGLKVGGTLGLADLTYGKPGDLDRVFQLPDQELSLVNFRRKDETRFENAWSYARLLYERKPEPKLEKVPLTEVSPPELARRLEHFEGQDSPHVLLLRLPAQPTVYILAIRGTKTWADWGINILGGIGLVPPYYSEISDLTCELKKFVAKQAEPGVLILTGHSLGGGIAEYAAARNGLTAVTFNSSHLSQPFVPDVQAKIYSYHVVGKSGWNFSLYSDIVDALRLGGNFEQTLRVQVPTGEGIVLKAHYLDTFYDWTEIQKHARPPATDIGPEEKLPRSELVDCTPNLVAELPLILRDSIRRADVDRSPAFRHAEDRELARIWDFRFRLGLVYDSRPSAGVPAEAVQLLDPPAGGASKADVARVWEFDTAGSIPLVPFSREASLGLNIGHQSYSYHEDLSHNLSTTSVKAELLFSPGVDVDNHAAVALASRDFKTVAGNAGSLLGVEISGAFKPRQWLFWGDAMVSSLRRADLPAANGTVWEVNGGLRMLTHRSTVHDYSIAGEARVFAGDRTSDARRLANTQVGGGIGLVAKLEAIRVFVEQSYRWTNHHEPIAGGAALSDREHVFRAEVSTAYNGAVMKYRFMGWEESAGVTLIRHESSGPDGNYYRRLFSFQLSKRY